MHADPVLLQRHAGGDQTAFAELVRRRVDFVYHVALRRTRGDAHLAQDITQQVFIVMAERASKLARHPALLGWLHRCACQRAAHAVRTEARRRVREHAAVSDPALAGAAEVAWETLAPELDEALGDLREPERELVLARYFAQASFAEIGARFGVSEAAAQMRLARALDKLRGALVRRGVTSTASALGVALTSHAAAAAPASAVASVTAACSAATAMAASAGGLGAAAAATFMSSAKGLGIVGVSALAIGGASWGVYHATHEPDSAPAMVASPVRAKAEPRPPVLDKDSRGTHAEADAPTAEMRRKRAEARAKLGLTQARLEVPPAGLIVAARLGADQKVAPRAEWTEKGKQAVHDARAWFNLQMDETGLWTTYGWEDDVARMEFEMEVERRLAAQLTADEYLDYLVRDSVTARLLKGPLVEFGATWPERAAIVEVEREFGSRWGMYGGKPADPTKRAEWAEARSEADRRLREALGEERNAAWIEAKRLAR